MNSEADIVETKPMLIEMGVGWVPTPAKPGNVTTATPGQYVAEIERQRAEITKLRAERDAAYDKLKAYDAQDFTAGLVGAREMRERCAKVAEAKREVFLSPQYATGQPMSSSGERFACTQIADEIRALPDTPAVFATDQTGGAT